MVMGLEPTEFETLVVKLLLKMGYGYGIEDAGKVIIRYVLAVIELAMAFRALSLSFLARPDYSNKFIFGHEKAPVFLIVERTA